MDARTVLLLALGVVAFLFIILFDRAVATAIARRREGRGGPVAPSLWQIFIGFVTDFFDTFGIGSYATTTSLYRIGRTVPDELIPGTLNVGHLVPTFLQAFIFMELVRIDPTTLIAMIGAAVAGAWLGAGFVTTWPRRPIQFGMGVALLVAAGLILKDIYGGTVGSGKALALEGNRLWLGIAGNFVLGTLMPLGIGLYGPCIILVSLLGMDYKAAFPIMMGSCAFLMPVANIQFIRRERYHLPAALGLTLGGVPAVIAATSIFAGLLSKPEHQKTVRWIILAVVVYTALTLLAAALAARRSREPMPANRPAPSA